ncbi:hypothetical protein VTO58DRAFT_101158 [Aureobasidium pullulans]
MQSSLAWLQYTPSPELLNPVERLRPHHPLLVHSQAYQTRLLLSALYSVQDLLFCNVLHGFVRLGTAC